MADWRSWRKMANISLEDAMLLDENSSFRSSISRYYYAVFQISTAVLIYCNQTPPHDREAWSHVDTPELLGKFLHFSGMKAKNHLLFLNYIREMYKFRVYADYSVNFNIDRSSLSNIRRNAGYVFKICNEILRG